MAEAEINPDTVVSCNVSWVAQFLYILHPAGFPDCLRWAAEMEAGQRQPVDAGRRIVAATEHLAHPSLTALRDSLPA